MSPVFLLYMCIIIGMIWAATGELNRGSPMEEVSHKVPIQKLAAVIGVKAAQRKG